MTAPATEVREAEPRTPTPQLRDARGELLPLVDQGVSSGSNFLLNTLVARASTPGEFAVFAVASSGYSVLQGVARAGLHLRLLARPDEARTRAAVGPVLRVVVAAAASLGVFAGVVFLGLGRSVPAALVCFFLPVVLLQDAQRFAAFVFRRDADALVSDLAWLLVTAVLVLAAWSLFGSVSPVVATGAWVAGGSAGVVVLLAGRRYVPDAAGVPLREWTSARATVGGGSEFLLAASVTFGVPLVAAVGYGSHGVSSLQGSVQFFAPIFAFQQGLSAPFIRTLVRSEPRDRRRVQLALTGLTAALVGVVVACMYAVRGELGPLLLGRLWPTTAPYVAAAACFVGARFIELPAYAMARFGSQTRRMVALRSTTSAITIGAFVIPMALGNTLHVAFWSFALVAMGCALGAQLVRWETACQ